MKNDDDRETTRSQNYVMAGAEHAPELLRLQHLEAVRDPDTFEFVRRVGVETGWRCLEVGAGAGSVTRHLAAVVGEGGQVVAADIDTRFLGEIVGGNVEARVHDLSTGPVEPADFDFAHCRALLTHLDDPVAGIAHLSQSVRPGGWVLCEEPDYVSMEPCDAEHPDADQLATFRAIMTLGGHQDGYIGRRIADHFEEVGLREVATEGRVRVVSGGSPDAMFRVTSIENTRHLLLDSGLFDDSAIDRLVQTFSNPDFSYLDATWIATWGRVRE